EEYVHVGDKIKVRLIEIDKEKGRLKVSLKALKEKPEGYVERVREERPRFERRDDRRGGDRRDDRRGGYDRRDDRRGGERRDDRRGGDDRPRREFNRAPRENGENNAPVSENNQE
ncbi:MAG: hypothetical protein PHD21_07135, partial [Flavobacteriales bacterium]|nr:hypothetical protein [Flavobacteriales bacterium]